MIITEMGVFTVGQNGLTLIEIDQVPDQIIMAKCHIAKNLDRIPQIFMLKIEKGVGGHRYLILYFCKSEIET